jgi:hypothetical protein
VDLPNEFAIKRVALHLKRIARHPKRTARRVTNAHVIDDFGRVESALLQVRNGFAMAGQLQPVKKLPASSSSCRVALNSEIFTSLFSTCSQI